MKIHNPAGMAPGTGYSHGIELPPQARLLYIAGQLGVTADGKFAAGIAGQAEQAWRNLGTVLQAAGMGYENLIKVTHFLVRREDIAAYREVRAKFLGKHAPASTLLVISALARPEALIEVEAIAAKE
jgi:2-iminobutanoate/2-iminopropanoate deaminase